MMPVRIVNGRVIDPSSGIDEKRDIRIDEGRIQAMSAPGELGAPADGEVVVDAEGKWVVPGLIDMHVHLREPGEEYKEDVRSGMQAAVRGGFSSICCMPNTDPVNDTRAVTEMVIRKAQKLGLARLYPIAAVTRGRKGEELTEMGDLLDGGAVAFSDDGNCIANANTMRCALEYSRSFDSLIIQHAQDPDLSAGGLTHEGPVGTRMGMGGWPAAAEEVIVARDIVLTRLTAGRYHLAHVSSAGSIEMIRQARKQGLRVSAEVTPHHLLLTDEATASYDTATKVNPPLRPESDRKAMVDALAEGVIEVVATDHAPHSLLEKEGDYRSAAFGISGLESAVALMLTLVDQGAITPSTMIRAMSTAPARILGLQGGTLAVGSVADVTVIDPEDPHIIDPAAFASRGHNTPFAGREVPGRAVMTIVGGEVVWRHGDAS
jgi:dihydroorotase